MDRSTYRTRHWHPRLRVEPLETRTLLHALTITFTDGILSILKATDGDDNIMVRLDTEANAVRVMWNGHEDYRVPSSALRGLNMRGLEGNDIAQIDTRLQVPVRYQRNDGGVVQAQLRGEGDGDDFCVATPDCEAFVFTSNGTPANPSREDAGRPADADNGVVRGVLFAHTGHGNMSALDGDDMDGSSGYATDGTGMMMEGHWSRLESVREHGMSVEPMFMGTMDMMVKLGTKPKWHPTACTCFGQRLDRTKEEVTEKTDCGCEKELKAEQLAAPLIGPDQGDQPPATQPAAAPTRSEAEEVLGPVPSSRQRVLDCQFGTLVIPSSAKRCADELEIEDGDSTDLMRAEIEPETALLGAALGTVLFFQQEWAVQKPSEEGRKRRR